MIQRLLLLFVITLSGCASSYQSQLKFNPLEPLRVAVLPFAQVNSDGEFISGGDADLAIDTIAFVSSELMGSPATVLQQEVLNTLSRTALDVVSPALVEAQLSHRGFRDPATLEFDMKKIFGAPPSMICKEILNCDAILYGTVTKWDRSYYGIQSVSTVGLDLRLVSANDQTELYRAQSQDSDSRGLTKGPTGFSDLVLEPIKGLSNDLIIALAKNVASKSLAPLTLIERPEYLAMPPPGILASSHDSDNRILNRNTPLTVVMLGSGGSFATFSIGKVIENIPMIETTEGHYIGEYYPLPSDEFSDESVIVRLIDLVGRETTQRVGKGPVTLSKG